jgi:hypothetical protein
MPDQKREIAVDQPAPDTPHPPAIPKPAFPALTDRLRALASGDAVSVTAGHRDLAEGLWLSCDPEGETDMTCAPVSGGFSLGVSRGDSGRWTCLGMRLPTETLARGRYLGLLIAARPGALVSLTPRLRYILRDGLLRDMGPTLPVVLPAGAREHLAHLSIDPALLARAETVELNLFFHTPEMQMTITRLEPLLIL